MWGDDGVAKSLETIILDQSFKNKSNLIHGETF